MPQFGENMKQLMIPSLLSLLTACGGYESQKEEENTTTEQTSTDTDFDVNEDVDIDENDRFADFIYLTEAAVGEMSCFDAGYDALGSWNVQKPSNCYEHCDESRALTRRAFGPSRALASAPSAERNTGALA